MKVEELLKLVAHNPMFRLVDATKTGYVFYPTVIFEGDKDAIRMNGYADMTLVGLAPAGKNTLEIYVK